MSDFAVHVLRALVESSKIEAFFEKVSANLWAVEPIRSFLVYVPANPGQLSIAHKYSPPSIHVPDLINLDGDSCAAKAFKSRSVCRDAVHGPVLSVPIGSEGLLTGALSLQLTSLNSLEKLTESDLTCLVIGVAAFIDNGFVSQGRKKFKNLIASPDDVVVSLTERQKVILGELKSELTYYQIARKLKVSESLVKLEVSRIFRYLGVNTRAMAASAAEQETS
jgi:DNA-binding CsgD family transcriptional regulator